MTSECNRILLFVFASHVICMRHCSILIYSGTHPDLLRQWIQEAEDAWLRFHRFLDHYWYAQRHEWLAEVYDTFTLGCDCHRGNCNIRFLQRNINSRITYNLLTHCSSNMIFRRKTARRIPPFPYSFTLSCLVHFVSCAMQNLCFALCSHPLFASKMHKNRDLQLWRSQFVDTKHEKCFMDQILWCAKNERTMALEDFWV